ncbi:MAG: hypothetical protein R3Y51_06055 [Rikenellaceae bacterium]
MTREQIKIKVLAAIDEVYDSTFSNLNIERPIETFLDESALQILNSVSDIHIDTRQSFIYNEHECNKDGCGWVRLPKNIVRVSAFRVDSWEKTITSFYRRGSATDNLQSNPYLRGGTHKPIVIIDSNKLYYYSAKVKTGCMPEIIIADAIPVIKADEKFPEKLITPLVWLCASKVLQILNDLTASDRALTQFNNLILMFK